MAVFTKAFPFVVDGDGAAGEHHSGIGEVQPPVFQGDGPLSCFAGSKLMFTANSVAR